MYRVDVYLRVRRAVMVDGMSMREAARVFGLHRDTVRKMLAYSVPPGYRRQNPPKRPKLEPFTGVIDQIPEDDLIPRSTYHIPWRLSHRVVSGRASGTAPRMVRPAGAAPAQPPIPGPGPQRPYGPHAQCRRGLQGPRIGRCVDRFPGHASPDVRGPTGGGG